MLRSRAICECYFSVDGMVKEMCCSFGEFFRGDIKSVKAFSSSRINSFSVLRRSFVIFTTEECCHGHTGQRKEWKIIFVPSTLQSCLKGCTRYISENV